ncbi:MAG: preprotein translocase subunit SecA [Spirochaetota bacterium]|nr:preprotein translocase subunit SecA [Spirochaetota bacterium]
MIGKIAKAIFGSQNERTIKKYTSLINKINSLEDEIKKLSDEQLKNKTSEFRHRLSEGQSLDDILPEAFATVREVSVRTLGMRHFDVQLIGGMVLHQGKIAEMKTGEGKTLAATLPAYLNALSGKGVHVVTVNDYLAKRDAEWMSPIYNFLGLSVGSIQHDLRTNQRREAYGSDITYGTNNEFGFDYLRDNMVESFSLKVQRGHNYCIVDEVDSILIDEARTPLIISGAAEESTDLYYQIDKIIPRLKPAKKDDDDKWIEGSGDYQFEEKDRNVVLSEQGVTKVEKLLGVENLYGSKNIDLVHHVNQALKAHVVFKRDVDYIVEEGEVIIIDEHTGRKMHGRRYSDGLHQALEAKERVTIEQETQTLASITFQNYFRMYTKLSGMTGTAETEAEEFYKIYKLQVVAIPTNVPMERIDNSDRIYRTEKEKFNAIANEIEELHRKGQPVLVGTISIEKNEKLSKLLKRRSIPHNVLNAKFHEMEATVVAHAGQKGAVTIATNMAGRGTDIKLGEGVRELGGLHILGTERHEARRIDNQLRGRSGRQGDPGSSRFYLSLDDDLLRLFGSGRIGNIMQRMGMTEGQEIEHPWITKAIANAQKKVESRNFEVRKHLLEYDDVMNRQRQYVYELRDKILLNEELKEIVLGWIEDLCFSYISDLLENSDVKPEDQKIELANWLSNRFDINISTEKIKLTRHEDLANQIFEIMTEAYDKREREVKPTHMRELERYIMLYSIDSKWKDHLYNMDTLKEGIHLRAYAEKNPLTEYKLEGSNMFEEMKLAIIDESVEFLFKVQVTEEILMEVEDEDNLDFGDAVHEEVGQFASVDATGGTAKGQKTNRKGGASNVKAVKVGRNDPCPCDSGKKYKSCCGK